MADLILSHALELGYNISEQTECVECKFDDSKLAPELVIASNTTENITENVNFNDFLTDLTAILDKFESISSYVNELRDCIYLPVIISLQKAISSSSDFTIAIQKRQQLRELAIKTIKNFEAITSNNTDFCQQLEDLCAKLSS